MKASKLLFALKLAQPCVVGVDYIPVLQHFCFNKKQVFAYDEVSAIIVDLETDLHCAVRADTLLQLTALAAEEVTLKEDNDNIVWFESGSTEVKLPSIPPSEFVFKEPRGEKGAIEFTLTNELFVALQVCAAGVGKDPHYRSRIAVALVTGKSPAVYAYDGTSIVRCKPPAAIGSERRVALIPKSVCDEIKSIVTTLGCTPEEVSVTLGKETIIINFKHDEWNVRLVGNLLTDEVNVKQYEGEIDEQVVLVRMDDEFANAVDKVAVVVSKDLDKICRIDLADGYVEVHGEGALGKATTRFKASGALGTKAQVAKAKAKAAVDPERLTRYRDRLSFISIDEKRITMFDNKVPGDSFLAYVSACF